MDPFRPDLPDSIDPVLSDDDLRQRLRRGRSRANSAIWATALAGVAGALASLAWLGPHSSNALNSVEQRATAQVEPIVPLHVAQAQGGRSAPPTNVAADLKRIEEMPTPDPAPSVAQSPVTHAMLPSSDTGPARPSDAVPPPAPAGGGVAGAPAAPAGSSSAEAAALLSRARDQIRRGDIAAARQLLARIVDSDGQAVFALAETYDPEMLARWGVIGVKPNPELARALYEKAAQRGVSSPEDRQVAAR